MNNLIVVSFLSAFVSASLFAQSRDFNRGYRKGYRDGVASCRGTGGNGPGYPPGGGGNYGNVSFCKLVWTSTFGDRMPDISAWGFDNSTALKRLHKKCDGQPGQGNSNKCRSIVFTNAQCFDVPDYPQDMSCTLRWKSTFGDRMPNLSAIGGSEADTLKKLYNQCKVQPGQGNAKKCQSIVVEKAQCTAI